MLLPCMQGMTPGSRCVHDHAVCCCTEQRFWDVCARPAQCLRVSSAACGCQVRGQITSLPVHALQVACACAELRSAAMLVTRCCVGSAARAATLHAVARSSFDGGVCTPLTVAEVAVSFACLAAWLLPNRRLIAACLPVPSYPRVLLSHASETFTSCS
ncbi:hypothetical protein COO60DRAFT_1591360, partial [Scenedesmus sp. NREL 46B-D3]